MNQPIKDHFDAAKIIVETLQGLDEKSRELAMRFASDTLGMPSPSPPRLAAPTVATISQRVGSVPEMDIEQFAESKAPQTDMQFAAVVAYFYRFLAPEADRRETIDADLLVEAARLVGRKRPAKAAQTLRNATDAGYLDAEGSGAFRLNAVGENLVAMTLPGNGPDGNAPRPSGKKRRTKKKPAEKARAIETHG